MEYKTCELIIEDSIDRLQSAHDFLVPIAPELYAQQVGVYSLLGSSIGAQLGHTLDFFTNYLEGSAQGNVIDFTTRRRDHLVRNQKDHGLHYIKSLCDQLKSHKSYCAQDMFTIIELLRNGKPVSYSANRIATLMRLNSHAEHHFAHMNELANLLGVEYDNIEFGVNRSTLEHKKLHVE